MIGYVVIEQVLCKDCVHSYIRWQDYPFALSDRSLYTYCKRSYMEPTNEFDPVIGNKTIPGGYRLARVERMSMYSNNKERCGSEGKYWQPKDKKNFLLYIKRI